MDIQQQFGARVRELRARADLTQADLAQRCGQSVEMQRIGEATSNLGESIFGQGRTADADLFLVSGYSIMIKSPMAHSPQAKGDLGPLEDFSQASGEPDRTVEFRAVFPVESARPAPYGP